MAAKNRSNELRITRIYDAPVAAVWDAWTDPKQAAMWWGPRGFTITTHSKDLRPGGTWKYTMHGPTGIDYSNIATYFEVEKHSKLVYDHGATETTPPMFRVTVQFSSLGEKTKMDMTMTLPTPEAAEQTHKFIKEAGGYATWDRLAEYLEQRASGSELFVIARSFDAPIERVFEMWTNPKHFSKWLPPVGAEMKFIRSEIRPGGSTFYLMTGLHGDIYGRIAHSEIERPNRIVYTQQFCDENEKIARPVFAPTWPETMLTIVSFAEEGPNRTRVSVRWQPYGVTTTEEIATFVGGKSGMTQGWTGSFDKLEAHLANL